jgi:ABC-type branched-subunit amino acid transport system substrate-binding protein
VNKFPTAVRHRLKRPGLVSSALAIVLLAACGGSTTTGNYSGPMLVGVIAPFSGADAALGPAYLAACYPAILAINNSGGVLGNKLSCNKFDTRGEPADAVPAANSMIANNPHMMAVVGCTSDEAASVASIIDRAKIPMFCMTGQAQFNKTNLTYFHRLVPPDEYDAYAMVGNALYGPDHQPYKNVALVFGNDIGSQAFVTPATNALTALGDKVVINQAINLTPGTTYRTEVQAMLNAHPDVILTEALGAAGTYLGEVKQQNGGKMIPFIGTSATIDPVWFKQVKDAIGIQDLLTYYRGVDLGYTFSGPAYDEFLTNINASASQMTDAPKYKQRGSTLHLYDGIIMTALAMTATNSTDPSVYNPKIIDIANGVPGATIVNTYADGIAALKAGKTIRFEGAAGANMFNQYNNSQSGYILVKYDANGGEVKVGELTQAQTQTIINAGGV